MGGYRMRYLRAGSGPPLLLIHGLLGYSFSWRFNVPTLSAARTIYAPDLLGTGFSDRPSDMECGARACAQRMLEFMNQMEIEAADLLGTSHGGGVAVMMSAMAPARVRKLVLAAPVNPWSEHGLWFTRLLATRFGQWSFQAATPAIKKTGQIWLARMYGDPNRIAPGTLEGYQAPFAVDGIWKYGLGIVANWQSDLRQLAEDYSQITQPTLLIWGDRDGAVFPASADEVLKRIPGARLKMLAGVGHMPYEEVPEEFDRVVLEFLD